MRHAAALSSRWGRFERAALAAALTEAVEGEIRFSDGDRALYAADASNYRQVPIGVVMPRSREAVVAAVQVCRRFGAPVLPRGAGTSLAGQCCNVGVVLDLSKHLDRVLEIDPERRIARVQPGVKLDDLRRAAEPHGLTFGPDPATHRWCTLGGMIGNNSCGVHSVMAARSGPGPRTEHQVESLEVLTYDGTVLRAGRSEEADLDRIVAGGGRKAEIYRRLRALRDRYADEIRERVPSLPRKVSGYNLECLLPEAGFDLARALVGTEATCVTVLEATVRLIPSPPCRTLLLLGYDDVFNAADDVPRVLEFGPLGLEGMDELLVEFLRKSDLHVEATHRLLGDGAGWLLVEFGGDTQQESDARARHAMEALGAAEHLRSSRLFSDAADQEEVWEIRESGLAATAWVPDEDDAWPGWEDSAVPPDHLGEYLRDLRELCSRYGYRVALYGHFGDGCVHTRINFELGEEEGIRSYRRFVEEAADLVVAYGGSLSGEHGDGQARGELLERMYGPRLVQAFREFKSIWDPEGRMNPGKVVDPYPFTENLRIGPEVPIADPETHFRFPRDQGSFARAALRCVGVGKCRKTDRGTMCPSYMVLEEEKHTTRGRAHLLFEMLVGSPVGGAWRDEAVKESLDLCLSCKGCKAECPVDVDIATYKAEFLAHYYEERLRPLPAYLFGNIDRWARAAAVAPRVANFLVHAPGLGALAKRIAGIPAERGIPRFAPRTFHAVWERRGGAAGKRPVILWVDTFNNHFDPTIALAAVDVLEDAGCRVVPAGEGQCCGRPLYEFGMLDRAKRLLRAAVDELSPWVRAGVPVVGLEPSCVAVFRDELVELFPDDEDARQVSDRFFTLGEFLAAELEGYEPPALKGSALVHGHCHQKAVLDFPANLQLLGRSGLDLEVPDSGCCGMAGAFGFARESYEVSIAAGERVLLPAVREAQRGTLVVTDGFSCREQIHQQTGRQALHLAEVLRIGLPRAEPQPGPRVDRAGERIRREVAELVQSARPSP